MKRHITDFFPVCENQLLEVLEDKKNAKSIKTEHESNESNEIMSDVIQNYSDLIIPTKTELAFKNLPLSISSLRGILIEQYIKEKMRGQSSAQSKCVNGRNCGSNSAPYDFRCEELRYEVKSSQLQYDEFSKKWNVTFKGIKTQNHDILYLACYTPFGIYVYEHDGKAYVSSHGKEEGVKIQINGSVTNKTIGDAWDCIKEKMKTCAFIARYELTEIPFVQTETEKQFKDIPLHDIQEKRRGTVIQNMLYRLLEKNNHVMKSSPKGYCRNGSKTGDGSTPYDFICDGMRGEVKSAQLSYHKNKKTFLFEFKAIKKENHDVLYLAYYTTTGIFFYLHDGRLGKSTHGKVTETHGYKIYNYASRKNNKDIKKSWNDVKQKLYGLKYIGNLLF